MTKKTLVEQLREMVEKSRKTEGYPSSLAEPFIGRSVECPHDERELFTIIADRIEREYMPRPRFEDGEPVNVGDMVLWNDGESKRVEHITVEVDLEGSCGTYNAILKRPQPDSLERIEEDARKAFTKYWGCDGVWCNNCPAMVDGKRPWVRYETGGDCATAQKLDMLRRQRELLEMGQE